MTDLETEKIIAECEVNAIPDEEIDLSEFPALTDEQLAQFKPAHPENFKETSDRNRPIVIRINNALADHLQTIGGNWENKVNEVLMNAYAVGQI